VPQLVRGLGLTAAISINVANAIGTGVFLKARVMTCNTGDPVTVMAVWLGAGLLVLAGALTYAELMAMLPEAGGEYVVLRQTFGKRAAFLYGWTYIGVSRSASLAAQAFSGAVFLNILTGGALEGRIVWVALVSIAVMFILNCLAVHTTGRIATVMTVIKVAAVFAVGAATFLWARGDWMNYALTNTGGACVSVAESARGGIAGFGAAMLGALWGYQGWQNLTPMIGEVRDPGRNIPRAFAYALFIVASLYLFANAAYFYALTPNEIASVPLTSSVATAALQRFLGATAASVMTAAMLISSLGALHTGMASGVRVPYAMARDGVFFTWFATIWPRTNVPVRSAGLIAAMAAALVSIGNYDKLTDAAVFALWTFYGLTAAAVFVLRRRNPEAARPYRVWGYPWVPGLFVVVTLLILLNALYTAPWQALYGIGFLVLGLPFYAYWSARDAGGSG
jgi:APA family basic amino acid/polyamine antiporter